jgi:hypothetical protein
MSEAIITTIITAAASLIVAFGTWHISMKKDREKQTEEVKQILNDHREEYLTQIRSVKDDITGINSNVQTQIALISQQINTLSSRVEKHNQIVERTYKLEELTAVQSEKISVANHRIDDLEHNRQ